jgi:hypothetical protein
MQSHHNKHHGAYVNSLDAALKDRPKLQTKPLHELIAHLVDVPEDIRTVVRNNAGGHANHTMFWQLVGGKGGDLPPRSRATSAPSPSCRRTSTRRRRRSSAPAGRWRLSIPGASSRWSTGRTRIRRRWTAGRFCSATTSGARLLPQIPEPRPRVSDPLVDYSELGPDRPALRGGEGGRADDLSHSEPPALRHFTAKFEPLAR